jgi:2-polyprenyl-3-methyl-5-hydroxy-6-metoxy-1,4-benzoquinol methylase
MTYGSQAVEQFFEQPQKYLHKRYGIRMRQYLLEKIFANTDLSGKRMLDAGCGDGSLSLPYANKLDELTLLDTSGPMIQLARQNVARAFRLEQHKVVLLNESLLQHVAAPYDVVLAIGLVSHVQDQEALFQQLKKLTRTNGLLVVQFSKADHWLNRLNRHRFKTRYAVTNYLRADILRLIPPPKFELLESYHYGFPFPGAKYFPDTWLFALNRSLSESQLAAGGSDEICVFRKIS